MTAQDELVEACHALAAVGLSPGSSGNVSVRVDDTVFATPSGASLRRVRPDALAVLRPDGEQIDGPKVTKEVGMHLEAYRVRPGTAAVVHLHSRAATAVSCLQLPPGDPLPPYTPYRIRTLGTVALVPYAPPGSAALTAAVGAAVSGSHVLLLANHGSLVCAPDVSTAVDLCEELEAAAELTLTLRGHDARRLDPATAWSGP